MRHRSLKFGMVFLLGAAAGLAISKQPALADGDRKLGEKVALEHCSRCHVVDHRNRLGGIGSTPSFSLLRRRADWEERFVSFFARRPHPAFVTVEGLSEKRKLPPNAAPVLMTEIEYDGLLSYIRTMKSN